jgi:hypothetical protein
VDNLHGACGALAKQVIEKARVEEKGERSIMGLMGEFCYGFSHVAAIMLNELTLLVSPSPGS